MKEPSCPIGDCDHNLCGVCCNGGFANCDNELITASEMDSEEMAIYDD